MPSNEERYVTVKRTERKFGNARYTIVKRVFARLYTDVTYFN